MKLPYLLQMVYSLGFNLVFRIFPSYLATFVSSAFQIGFVQAGYNLANLLTIPAGIASDRMGKGRAVFLSFLGIIFIALALSISLDIFHFIALFFLLGVVSSLYYSSITSWVADLSEQKTEALFRLESAYQLGFVVGPLAGGFLVLQYGMVAALYTWALLGLVGAVLSLAAQRGDGKGKGGAFLGFFSLLKGQKLAFLLFMVLGSLFTGLVQGVLDLAIPLYATSLGMDIFLVGMIFGLSAALNVVLMLVMGKRLEKAGLHASLVLMLLFMGIPFLLLSYAKDIISITLLVGLASVGRAGGLNVARSFLSARLDKGVSATGMGVTNTFHYLGRVAGPLYAGVVIDLFAFSALFFSISLAAFAGIIAIAALSRVGRSKGRALSPLRS